MPQKINRFKKIAPSLLLAGLVNCSSGSGVETCENFSDPGEYEVKPCDVFEGPFGVDFVVNKLDSYGQIRGDYLNDAGEIILPNQYFGKHGYEIAHYGLKLHRSGNGRLVLSDTAAELYKICLQYLPSYTDPKNHCSIVSPTEAFGDEVIFESEGGYFGKTNYSAYPQLAECAAKDIDSIVLNTSEFLQLPPIPRGFSYLSIFKDKEPIFTGEHIFSIAVWYYEKKEINIVKQKVEECAEKIESGNFSKGDHELTHAFTGRFPLPFTFSEGLANYVPKALKGHTSIQWNSDESFCKKEGFQQGYNILPYIKYRKDPKTYDSYFSGECFWQKLVFDYGKEIIPQLMQHFKENAAKDNAENNTFEENLKETGIDLAKYWAWGLVEQ